MSTDLMMQDVVGQLGWVGHHMIRWLVTKSQSMGVVRKASAGGRDQEL